MPWYSGLSAGRSHEDAGQEQKLLPDPSLEKVGWYAAALAGVAGMVLFNPFAIATSVDPGAVQAALTMVALGVLLPGMGLTLAAGILAASYRPHGPLHQR